MRLSDLGSLVYSTESGRMCPDCRQPVAQCACAAARAAAVPAGDGIVRVSRETKGRGGKAVTLVKGVALPAAELAQLGKQLKAACGTGGTVKDGVIEVQGRPCGTRDAGAQGARPHGQAGRRLSVSMDPAQLERLFTVTMPFGKHKGTAIADLPGNYLNWFAREGFPSGDIGRLLALMHEIDHNGLGDLLAPLRAGRERARGG